MIRRNVSGQVIYFPQLTTVDGTPITSAATITVAKDGVEAASAGTLTHSSGGVWKYTPTAGESDAAIVGLVLTGTNAIPVVLNLVTTAANTAAVAFGANTTTPPTAAANADAVWDEPYNQHTTAGTFGKLMDILRKSNTVIEGTILASPTPTTTTFRISGADYPTGALEHAVLWMSTGTSAEQNSPILTTVNNGDGTLTITLEEALVTAPIAGDVVLIDPTSHVHAIVDIVSGVWSALTSGLSVVGSTGRALARLIGLVVDDGGDEFTAKSLSNAPAGGVQVLPAIGVAAGRGDRTTLVAYVAETITTSITVYQADGTTAYNLSGKTLAVIFENPKTGDDVAVVASGSITISGTDSNVVTFAYPSAATSAQRELTWTMRDASAPKTVYLRGVLEVRAAATVD